MAELYDFFADRSLLDFSASSNPAVSVIVVSNKEAELTLKCLKCLSRMADLPVELIIVDNASSDETGYLLDKVVGATVVRNVENLGFTRAANQGASRARGKMLCFLANGDVVDPSAVSSGFRILATAKDIGAVCGQVVRQDGALDSAGYVVWSNGDLERYGHGKHPKDLDVQFRREVDHAGEIGLFVRRELFERLGRFDPSFASHSYATADLCAKIRKAGSRVLYDPGIQIFRSSEFAPRNNKGASEKPDDDKWLFSARHAAFLTKMHLPPRSGLLNGRSADRWRPRVLLISGDIYPLLGSRPRSRRIRVLESLSDAGYSVAVGITSDVGRNLEGLPSLLPSGVEGIYIRSQEAFDRFLKDRADFYHVIIADGSIHRAIRYLGQHLEHFARLKLVYFAESAMEPEVTVCGAHEESPSTMAHRKKPDSAHWN